MTHTLHRRPGVSRSGDWVVLAMAARGAHRDGAGPRLQRFLELARRHGPVNLGDMRTGTVIGMPFEAICDGVDPASIVHAVFDCRAKVRALLDDLRAADLGVSVVVTGDLDAVDACCRDAGLEPHTVALSLGVWGRTERLPPDGILEITTLCGHGAVAPALVEDTVARVADGRLSLADGVARLGRPCACGAFNPTVAREALAELVGDD